MTQEIPDALMTSRNITNSAEILPSIQITNCANRNLVQWFADKDVNTARRRRGGGNHDIASVCSEMTKQFTSPKRPSVLVTSERGGSVNESAIEST